MNIGLLRKGLRETWLAVLLCGLGVAVFEAIAAYVFFVYQDQFAQNMDQIEVFRKFISSLVGQDMSGNFGPEALNAIPWVHPLFLALIWAFAIFVCTRVPAGEIDRGTVDVLLALPVSRTQVFAAEALVSCLGGLGVLAMALAGHYVGRWIIPPDAGPDPTRLLPLLVNLYALFLVFAGMTTLFSCLADRRGRAVGTAFGVVLVLFLWNFLAEYWEPAEQAGILNVLSYYKPMPILAEGAFPTTHIAILLAIAIPLWLAAWKTFQKRDICTV